MARAQAKSTLTDAAIYSIAVILVLACAAQVDRANAAPTTITAYASQYAVSVKSPYQASQWTDTPSLTEPTSGMTFAVKQNGTGWLFVMRWQTSASYCSDQYCYGGIELGPLSNTEPMGSSTTPTIMILASTSFTGGWDEFISTGEQTPASVESMGYKTQSVCGLSFSGSSYTAVCYRPFKLTNASPYDFPTLGVGSTIEIGFAVGEFSEPGIHAATQMTTYVLTFSSQTYSSASTSSSSSSTSSSSTSSSSTSSTSTTSTSSSSTSSSSSSSTSTSSSSTTTSKSSTSTSSTSTSTTTAYSISVSTNSSSYSGTQLGLISGKITGSPTATGSVVVTIVSPSNHTVFSDTIPVQSGGSFSVPFLAYGSVASLWTSGTYKVTATWTTLTATSQFSYTPPPTPTTSTSTVTTTLSGPATTQTVTTVSTSTITSTSVPAWAYGIMIILLVIGFAVGYVLKGPIAHRPAVEGVR